LYSWESKLEDFLETEFLKDLIEPKTAYGILKNDIDDYFVLKTYIENVLLSIDVITIKFFKKICNINLVNQRKTFISHKYGNEPQLNSYPVSEFNGKIHIMRKINTKEKSGNSIKLPLFFISNEGKYIYGIPTIKYITHKIFYDPKNILKQGIDNLYRNLIRRLLFEYPALKREKYYKYFLNVLKGRDKFPKRYMESILNKIDVVIDMEQNKDKLKDIKREIYLLFKNNAKNEYTDPNWIFPNHFDIMSDLAKEMCEKYGGNVLVCELAILLHDVGLVYKRENQSSEGHEKRSIEYAKKILKNYEISEDISKEVIECIISTEKDGKGEPKSINAKILRTADILSQFISVHYFAKASFFNNWNFFMKWMRNRIESCYNKISFEDEKKIAKPIVDYMLNAIELYDKYNKNYPLKEKEDRGEKNEPSRNN